MVENCGGGEVWLWDVESERDEVIVGEDDEAGAGVESERKFDVCAEFWEFVRKLV